MKVASAIVLASALAGILTAHAANSPSNRYTYTPAARIDAATGTPRALYFLNEGPFEGTPEQIARQFLKKNIKPLRLSNTLNDVELVNVQESPMGHHVTFRQKYAGIPVYRSDIVVTIDRSKKVVFATNNFRPGLKLSRTTPKFNEAQAIQTARRHLRVKGKLLGEQTSTLMIYAEERVPRLTYRVTIATEDPMGDWEVFVDALSGEVISVTDLMEYDKPPSGAGPAPSGLLVNGTGYVFDPDPLTSARVPRGSAGYIDNNDADSPQLDSARTLATLNSITLSGGVYSLTGPYVQISDFESPADTFPTPASADSFRFNRRQKGFEAVMAYHHIDKTQRYIQSLGFNGIQNRSIPADPHGLNGADNSHYVPSVDKIAFGDGGVDDAEDATVILHEYGHAIQNSEKPGWGASGGEARHIGEGFGDYWAGSYLRANFTYNIDSVFNWDGTAASASRRTLNDPRGYPQNGVATLEVHDAGQIWSSVLMLLWGDLGRTVMDKLVLQSHYLLGAGPTMHDNACAIIQADRSLYAGAHINTLVQRFISRGFLRVDIEFVIDDTGSMSDEIDDVRTALTAFLQNFTQDTCIVYQLTTFKDNVTQRDLTVDLATIRNEVAGLVASGGDDCPEGSVEALNSVKDTVRRGGTILFVTDASPHPGADIDGTVAALRARGIRVNVLLSGDCYISPSAEEGNKPDISENIPGGRPRTKEELSGQLDRNHYKRAAQLSDTLILADDDFVEVNLPFAFPFCGRSYSSAFVGSNGYVTFGTGYYDHYPLPYYLLNGGRRIAGLFADLNPPGGGSIVAHQVGSDFDVSYANIRTYSGSDTVTFTIRLRPDGSFRVNYVKMASTVAGIAGFSAGNGVSDPGPADLSVAAQPIQATGSGTAYESFSGSNNDLAGLTLEYAACTYHPPTGSIGGLIWNDANKNSIRDSSEGVLGAFSVYAAGPSYQTTLSDSFGRYRFGDLLRGSYSISVGPPSGWTTVYPLSGSYSVSVDSGTADTTKEFGELLGSGIYGVKFYDANNNGTKDPAEPNLSGVRINLAGPETSYTYTSSYGDYSFIDLPTGTYTLTEQIPAAPGWSQTYPPGNAWTVVVDTGGLAISNKDFGNYGAPGSISGTVFNDLDNDGVKDSNDYGLAGWTVTAYSGGTYIYTVTDSGGNYTFGALPPGSYNIYQTVQGGYVQTYPLSAWTVQIDPGTHAVGKDFGDHKLPTSYEAFSKLAFETGGFFAFIPATVLGDTSEARRFINTAYNVLQGGITKSVGVIEPSKVPLGTTVTVDVSGSNTDFQAGTSFLVSGSGVTATNVKVISPIKLEADVTVDPGASLGFRDIVTVTDLGGGQFDTAVGKGSLELIPTPLNPTILGIAPNVGARGDSIVVIVSAVNTNFADSSVVKLGIGVTVTGHTALSPTKLRASVKIAPKSDIGFRDVSVTTGAVNAGESVPGPFFVSNSAPLYAFLASVGPGSAFQGDSLTIHIVGTNANFTQDVSVVSFSGSGIEVVAERVASTTTLDLDMVVDPFAPAGYRDVFVTTGSEVAAVLNAFNVLVKPTSVVETHRLPSQYSLSQSYPNPFNPSTTIQFDVPRFSLVTVKIYDVLGREITTLLSNAEYVPGTYNVRFDGSSLASGVYFYSLRARASGGVIFEDVKKMIFMK